MFQIQVSNFKTNFVLGDDDYMDDNDEGNNNANGSQSDGSQRGLGQNRTKKQQSQNQASQSRPNQEIKRGGQADSEEEDKYIDDFSISSENEEDDGDEEEEKKNLQSDSERASSRLSRTPVSTLKKNKKGKVQFSMDQSIDNENQEPAYKGVDLSVLYKTKNEIIYRLTELYLPQTAQQRQKMIEYNKEKMSTQNDIENEVLRTRKRKLKEEIKHVRAKLKHQIKYCNPAPLLDDAFYLYTPGMTTRQLEMQRNKYAHAPHIGRILPQKRHINQQQIAEQQKNLQQQALLSIERHQKQQQDQIKSYLLEDQYGLDKISMLNDLINNDDLMVDQALKEERLFEQKYLEVSSKINDLGLSISDLSQEDRKIIKTYLKQQAKVVVDSKYPELKLNKVEKSCYEFMKHFSVDDYSYKGQKSAIQSDDNGMFLADLIDDHQNQNQHPIFNLTNLSTVDNDRMSINSLDMKESNRNRVVNNDQEGHVKDYQLQEWFIEQKYKIMSNSNSSIKRRKYWGEPTDCSSNKQIQKDYYLYKQYQNKQYVQRGCKEEKIFKIDKVVQQQKSSGQGNKGKAGNQEVQIDTMLENESLRHQVKDIKEYEYFKQQEQNFYEDTDKKLNVNSIMRNLQFDMGLITEEEFYAQEDLEDQLEQQQQQQQQVNSGVKGSAKDSIRKSQGLNAMSSQQRKEQVLNDFVDNFDLHFERRKKELHEVLLKKIQQHEKANQQTSNSGQTQTIAYATRVLQVSGAQESGKDKQDHQSHQDYDMNNHEEEMALEEEKNQSQKQINHHEGLMVDDNMHLRVTKSRANELNHAKCILKLTYTRFDWSEQALMNFHRPNINDIFQQLQYDKERQLQLQEQNAQTSRSTFVFSQGQLKLQEKYNSNPNQSSDKIGDRANDYVNLPIKIITNEQIERRAKKVGIINAHDYFRDRFKLSLKDGKFCIFEHIDQQPLFVNDFGMASKLKRYVYADKFLPPSAFFRRGDNQKTRHMGPHGVQILKKKGEKIPLLGQIDTKQYMGITVMENNMYYCPVFYHKPQRNDFFCVLHRDKHQNPTIVVRELSELYVMGQEEPKIEVYNPQSRQYQHFIKRRTQAYVIRFLQENSNYISFQELNKFFPYINDQILKKIIKEISVEVDRNQYCMLSQEYNDEQFRQLITPENICQYESAQYGEQMLKKVGIRDITNADKISYATNKFCSEEQNFKKQLIARIIEEEVLSTPWNLSQSFLHNKQTRGMMMLEGIGDPSHGHGGYSYLKLPLKISQDSLNKAKANRMYLNPAIQNPKAVTGTDADLRKLSKKEIKNKLIDLGFKEEQIGSFTRWEMVALLRDKSSQAVSQGMEGEMKKFARGVRFTSKKQREMYQKQVNDIFKKQMSNLSKETGDHIPDVSDGETRDQRQKKINDHQQQLSNNYSKNIIELKEDIEVKNIKDIPNYEILIMANQVLSAPSASSQNPPGSLNIGSNSMNNQNSQSLAAAGGYDPNTGLLDREAAAQALKMRLQDGALTLKCTILRKKIKHVNNDQNSISVGNHDKIERVNFCSDPRQIKGFNKRKNKHEVKTKRTKKTSLKEKMQISKPMLEGFSERPRGSETSSVIQRQPAASSSQYGNNQQTSQEPVKIKIGGQPTPIPQIPDHHQSAKQLGEYNRGGASGSGSMSISISQFGNQQPKNKPAYHRFQSQMQLSSKPYDQLSYDGGSMPGYNMGMQQQQYDQNLMSSGMGGQEHNSGIVLSLGKLQDQSTGYDDQISQNKSKSRDRDKKKSQNSKNKKSSGGQTLGGKSQPKFVSTTYDDDFETYKPKTQGSTRRRQQSGESLLNEIFAKVIDQCQVQDIHKFFYVQVKPKEAPNYYEVIKNPIALIDMKNKTKRNEYQNQAEILRDFALMRANAVQYNGEISAISQLARDIEEFAKQRLAEQENDIKNLELLVQEQKNSIIKI